MHTKHFLIYPPKYVVDLDHPFPPHRIELYGGSNNFYNYEYISSKVSKFIYTIIIVK
jgi:hypothetical protein